MIRPLIEGLALTFRYCFSKRVTMQYPEQKWDVGPRWRGRHLLLRRKDGSLRCVACMLCATVCPAQCIKIEPAADPKYEKYPKVYEIDLGKCIFCGFCVEACPKEAIIMTEHYEIAEYDKGRLTLSKEELMEPPPGYSPEGPPRLFETRMVPD